MAVRTNLVTNPSFEVDYTSGWTGFASRTNATPARVFSGTYYATTNTGGNAETSKFPATAGLSYSASAYLSRASTSRTAAVTIHFYDASNAELSPPTITQAAIVLANTAERHSAPTRTAPAGTTQIAVRISYNSAIGVDAVLLEQSSTVAAYFDGSSAQSGFTYAWTGTAHASSSTENVGPRTNLMPTPDFESGLGAWNNYGGESTIAQSSVQARTGTYSMTVTRPAGTGRVTVGHGTTSTGVPTADSIPVSPGESVTVSMYVRDGSGAEAVFPMIIWQNASAFTTAVSGSSVTANSTWQRISVTAVAPAGTTQFGIAARVTSATSGQFFYVDDVLVEKASTLNNYFDGGSSNSGFVYAWTGTAHASTSTETISTGISSQLSGSGTLTSVLTDYQQISSNFTGSGTLTSQLTNYQQIASDFTGSGTLTSALVRHIHSDLSGSGTLVSVLTNYQTIESQFSGSGTLSSVLTQTTQIASALSGSGTLTSVLHRYIQSNLSGSGTLSSVLTGYRSIDSNLSGSGTLSSVLDYTPPTPPAAPASPALGKLVSFNVSTSAVPLNPAEGSGAAPSVNAGYLKGVDPEFALGETNILSWGTVGTYEGEIVRLSLPEGSDVASIGQDTLLTLLNNDMTLFPFIDLAPSVWTAARAIDYWSQQCGLFYDKVPGDAIAYASGFGHIDSYGTGTTARFYEKLVGGTTATTVIGSRSVKTLGSAVTGTTAFHELVDGSVPVSVPSTSKLVASIGLGLRGTGRTSTVTWNFLDAQEGVHTIAISATSAGAIEATVDGASAASVSVAPNGDYRVTFSVGGTLTVHTDDLAGSGTLVDEDTATGSLPNVMFLTSITHVSAGGSGAEMLRWGTYLTVAKTHPRVLPVVQKAFSATGKEFGFVSGFEGNVWALLNEYCAITRQDIAFTESKMQVIPRISTLANPLGNFSGFSRDSERRDKYKQVAVVNKQSRAVSTDDAVLWRADSVFQVAAREVFETTVQTPHSILNVVQPVAVEGILPFPYTVGGGQYVVTGADGYIVAPAWWNDNGGLVEVSLTGKEGEIAIKITAPAIDTVRAPYRISEGAADRPALYVCGSGILNDPKEVHVGTGAKNAKEGFDQVFESPFVAGVMETYDTAAAMAAEYSASAADVSFEIPNDFNTPSRFGQFPAGTRFTDGVRNYRIASATQTHSRVSGNAVPHTTIGDYVASYPPGSTLADEMARHAGRTIKQFNIKPLRGTDDNA